LVKKLELDARRGKTNVTSGLEHYDEEFYQKQYNKESAKYFITYVKEVIKVINTNGWNLETKYNKHYCGFKAGFFNAFAIKWVGIRTSAFFFKIIEQETNTINISITKYKALWKEAVYYIEPKKTETNDFIGLFEMAYKKLTGE